MKTAYSFLGRTIRDSHGLDLWTPDSDYWMIDDGHISALRYGEPRGNWGLVNTDDVWVQDLSSWGFELAKCPRTVMLNIERMDCWAWCVPALTAICDQLRALRDDVTICLYAHNDEGHATGIVDSICKPANNLGINPDAPFDPSWIPVLHPANHGTANTLAAMRVLAERGFGTLLLWEVCDFNRYKFRVGDHAELKRSWTTSRFI